jgi:hypothetical protein
MVAKDNTTQMQVVKDETTQMQVVIGEGRCDAHAVKDETTWTRPFVRESPLLGAWGQHHPAIGLVVASWLPQNSVEVKHASASMVLNSGGWFE